MCPCHRVVVGRPRRVGPAVGTSGGGGLAKRATKASAAVAVLAVVAAAITAIAVFVVVLILVATGATVFAIGSARRRGRWWLSHRGRSVGVCRSGFTTLPPVPLQEQYRCGSFVGGAQIARGVGYQGIRWTRRFTWFGPPEHNTLRPQVKRVVLLCLSARLRSLLFSPSVRACGVAPCDCRLPGPFIAQGQAVTGRPHGPTGGPGAGRPLRS
jgi:hypothetical protein